MDFCDDCGILLPVNLKSDYCNPCGESRKQRHKANAPCECEMCHRSGKRVPLSSRGRENYAVHKVAHPVDSVGDTGTSRANVQPCAKTDAISPLHHATKPDDFSSWSSVDADWTVVQRKQQVESPKGKKDLAEDCVASDVREKWEREQKDYKRQLCTVDTPAISALVGGCRRKQNGDRFYVGGVDISFIKGNNIDACACLSVIQLPNLQMVYQRMEMIMLTQPYIPGFLAFREVPSLVDLYHEMEKTAPQYLPDIIMVDGNGTLHPRGFGLACQLGVVLDVPTLGVAKTLMSAQGIVDDEAHKKRKKKLSGAGDGFDLVADSGEVLGRCVQVHDQAPNPVYISVGHKISLNSAVWLALECSKYRIPEPVRRSDLDSREYLRQNRRNVQEFILN